MHVIQFLLVRADLCPIQMTPPRYHVAIIKRLLLHVSYLSLHAFMRTKFLNSEVPEGRNAPHRRECDNYELYGKAETKNVQLALQHGCNTS